MQGRNILHNTIPAVSIAQFDSAGGRGIVETSDGKVYSYDSDRPQGKRFVEEHMGFHPGMWLQPAMSAQLGQPILFRPSGEYPFAELERLIELRYRVSRALRFFLSSLDHELRENTRRTCAREATRLLNEVAVRTEVEPVLMNTPLPKEWVTDCGPEEGAAGEILRAVIAKWRPEGEQEYVVSFRRGKRMSDLRAGDAAELSTYLQALGLRVIEVLPKGESVAIRATASDLHELYGAIAAVCDLVPRTVGTH